VLKVRQTLIPDVLVIEPQVFRDERGFFYESYNEKAWLKATGMTASFVQDNHSGSLQNTLRGLHYQIKQPQGKLVRVVVGAVFDVAIDLRSKSPTFGDWVSQALTAEDQCQLWIPEGFAHGFLVLSEYAEVVYKTTNYYAPEHERCILWNDPDLAIAWPLQAAPILSAKDGAGVSFRAAEIFP
jgi:dTDP-4-dehydrorhamnose 3,5-epimerase